jgi:CheY-like chemotaxis protein
MDAVSLVGKMRVQKQFQKLPIFVLADQKTALRADDALASGANQAFLKDESGAINSIVSAIFNLMTPSLARKPAAAPVEPVIVHSSAPPSVVIPFRAPAVAVPAIAATAPVGATAAVPAPVSAGVLTLPARALAPTAAVSQIEAAFDRGAFGLRDQPEPGHNRLAHKNENIPQFLDIYGEQAHCVRQDFIRYRTAGEKERPEHLSSLLNQLSGLNNEASGCGLVGLSRYLTVIESRVRQLHESGAPASPSSLQGIATALDALAALNNHVEELEPLNNLNPLALIVDDDAVCRKTLSLGLEKAKIKTTGVDNPDAALLEAESKPFDLIFLDVDLPKMNGFALCARIRIIPSHRKTPILFVTSLNDIKSRASSRVSGGNDFITKPINLYEIGINSWSLIINRRVLQNASGVRA